MNCCVKCFNDYEIQSIIGTNTKVNVIYAARIMFMFVI